MSVNGPRVMQRGPIHVLDEGTYRAVIRDGVPMIEREVTASAVRAVLVPVSNELLAKISAEWSEPVQFRIEDGEFVFRKLDV